MDVGLLGAVAQSPIEPLAQGEGCKKRQRRGHLFQGRYKSILVDADEYFKELSRYIHLNPMRAKMVDKLSSYPWRSYQTFIGKIKAPSWLETDWLLFLFGERRKPRLGSGHTK